MQERDEQYMRYALELARRGRGLTSPNPMVGAVVVQGDQIVGEGYHRYSEQKHAEIWALEQAGERAQNATLYINLEPCSHFGRTPPCVDRVINAGLARVVAAMQDPNALVAGKGFQRLRDAGISLTVGTCQAQALKLNEAYCKFIQSRRPFVILKTAMTLDGKVAEASGHSRWITGEPARERVQQLRFEADALLTGIGTILADDPLLTDRTQQPRRRPLIRVVLDAHLRLPVEARIAASRNEGDILLFCSEASDPGRQQQLKQMGLQLIPVETRQGRIPFEIVLNELSGRDVTLLLIEAGPKINFDALRCGAVDKVLCFMAPKLLGGQSALSAVGGEGFLHLDQALRLSFASAEAVGDDLLIEAYVTASS